MAGEKRFVGLDIHKDSVMVAMVDIEQKMVLEPRRINLSKFSQWATANLLKTDVIALEATGSAWSFYDQLVPLVGEVKVANAMRLRLIAESRAKTDKHDALVLAKLLAANLLPEVWVPPQPVRELRSLVAHRQRLVRERSAAKNRLHSVLQRYQLTPPKGKAFTVANQPWWEALEVPTSDKLRIRHELLHIRHLTELISETEDQLAQLSITQPWSEQVAFLIQIPGIGLNSAMTLLAAIGVIERFASSTQLVGYAGLGASVYASGQTVRTGKITKQGRKELRTTLVECAWITIRCSPFWRSQFNQLAQRMSKNKAITVIARKLLVAIWHVLSKREPLHHADDHATARKLLVWGQTSHLAVSLGIRQAEFARRELQRLGLAGKVQTVLRGTRLYQLTT